MRWIWPAVALAALAFAAAGCGPDTSAVTGNPSTDATSTTAGAPPAGLSSECAVQIEKAAPDELKADYAVLLKIAVALKRVKLKAGETPSSAQRAKLALIAKSLRTKRAQEASANIAAWSQKHCGKQ